MKFFALACLLCFAADGVATLSELGIKCVILDGAKLNAFGAVSPPLYIAVRGDNFTIGTDKEAIRICLLDKDADDYVAKAADRTDALHDCLDMDKIAAGQENPHTLYLGPQVNTALDKDHGLTRPSHHYFRYEYRVDTIATLDDQGEVQYSPVRTLNKQYRMAIWLDDNRNERIDPGEYFETNLIIKH